MFAEISNIVTNACETSVNFIQESAKQIRDRITGPTHNPSKEAYDALTQWMAELQQSKTTSLREKKEAFLAGANDHIQKLTTEDLLRLFANYQLDFKEKIGKYKFIYQEDDNKVIGWIKHTVFREQEPTGNTHTHKQFLGLLKARAIANISKDDLQLAKLMTTSRGRIGNPFSSLGVGYEGKYEDWKASKNS
jgi:hypothetical protein